MHEKVILIRHLLKRLLKFLKFTVNLFTAGSVKSLGATIQGVAPHQAHQ